MSKELEAVQITMADLGKIIETIVNEFDHFEDVETVEDLIETLQLFEDDVLTLGTVKNNYN